MDKIEDSDGTEIENTKKRAPSSDDKEVVQSSKKAKIGFSAKEFRSRLKTDQKIIALQDFLRLINEESKEEYVLAYLNKGGSPLEILQVMENDPNVSPLLIFEITNEILLQINAKLEKFQNLAYESSRYLLNTYLTLINKMLGLSSSMKERLVMLKLLTTIATFSVILAKDILLHVNFNPSNLELLTKVSEGKNEVRNAFVHFITAFLVGGHFPTLSVLLEKKGMMTSIINGLKYDRADTVVLVLTVMKNHILENLSVSKTVKMKTFSTPVVKDIVNLYNWKGPGGIPDQKKKNKVPVVDEIDKSRVSEAVHSFLLVLCTSHKFGVIFKDYSVGLNKKHQNLLMYTVLESLERPWEHSYASELVIKICRACPDLTKTMWMNLKPFIEPRPTIKWLNAMKFSTKLLDELEPECIEFCIGNQNTHQLAQIIQVLVVPIPILKTLISDDGACSKIGIKYNILLLLLKMAKSVKKFLNKAKEWANIESETLNTVLSNHLNRNFPSVKFILTDWDRIDNEETPDFEICTVQDYLGVALDLLDYYKDLAPKMLDDIGSIFDIKDFLSKTEIISDESKIRNVQIKGVKLFLDLEPALFAPKTELFDITFIFALKFYHLSKDLNALYVLNRLLKNTGIFNSFHIEIDLWIDGVLNLKHYDESVGWFLRNLIKKADENGALYDRKLFEIKDGNFSPLILALNDYLNENEPTKTIKCYLNFVILNLFHLQNNKVVFKDVISGFPLLSKDLSVYIEKWSTLQISNLNKCKGTILDSFRKFSVDFIENDFEIFDFDLYHNFKLNLLQSVIFYINNLIKSGMLKENHMRNGRKFINLLHSQNVFEDDRYVYTVLANPSFLSNLNLFDSNDFSTSFLIEIVKNLKSSTEIRDDYLVDFRQKIVSIISKVFRKPEKYQDTKISIEILEIFELEHDQCVHLLEKFVNRAENRHFYSVASYCLNRIANLSKFDYGLEPLSNEIIRQLSHCFVSLIQEQIPNLNCFSLALLNYLKIFVHNLGGIEIELFDNLLKMSEFHKDNLLLCEFLLDRKPEFIASFEENLDEICSKKGFILSLLNIVISQNNEILLKTIFDKFEKQILKALQKPHKAGQHFQNHYKSVGILIEKFMQPNQFGGQIQKFETTELFHVFLLKKIYQKIDKNEKTLTNMILTFIHLLVNLLKQKGGTKEILNLVEIAKIFDEFLDEIDQNLEITSMGTNETFKMFSKLCLKYGVIGDTILLKILAKLVNFSVGEEEARLIMDMLLSHSQFLDVVLGDKNKGELLNLWLVLVSKWPTFMERSHVPVLLSAYKATRAESDRIILNLLKLYESTPDQTQFYEFKPFLWGRAAVSYYSIRSDVQKVLWKQPKMGDVLDNLHQPTITATINDPLSPESYDLDYFLPLFSLLLAPENPVHTYRFTKSGALALTITGLKGIKSQRLATCHVLSRFYFHLEAKQTGKDNLLWLRFVEAICKGVAVLDDFHVNNFVGVFLARTALILTQPGDMMYIPLTQYLAVKDSLDFTTIPELYTFLHSPHVDSKQHKHFILEVLRDGLKTDKDFTTFLKSMGFKLISELCSSTVCDFDTKILILDIFKVCCRLHLGVKILCGNLSFLSQIFSLFIINCQAKEREIDLITLKLLEILLQIVEIDSDRHRNYEIYLNLMTIAEDDRYFNHLKRSNLAIFYQILVVIIKRFPLFFSVVNMDNLLRKSDDKFCRYLVKYGCNFFKETDFCSNNLSLNNLRILFYNKFK